MNGLTVLIDQFLQSAWVQNVGWTLLHSLWQITLIAALYAVAAVALRNRAASLRYFIGCAAMAAMLVVPVATFCMLPSPRELVDIEIAVGPAMQKSDQLAAILITDPQGPSATSTPMTNSVFDPDFPAKASVTFYVEQPSLLERITLFVKPWLPTATVIWLFGVLLLSLRPVLGCLRVQTLRSSGLTPLAESHCQLAQRLASRLGIRHVVQFAQSALVEVPTVIGYLRPMVLLPASSVTGLTTAELELILAHELAHIRRHDYALNLIQTVIEALLFYHPGMWWVSSQVRRERENCCDDVAVAIRGDRATYIRALAQLEEHRIVPPALGASGNSLLMRVRRLLDQPQSEFGYRKSSVWLTVLILGVSLAVAAMAGNLSGSAPDEPDKTVAESSPAEGDDGETDSAELPTTGLSPRETVAQFLSQLGAGKKTINGIRGSWDHAWAYTTRENGWSKELVKLAGNKAFQPIASLGTDDRMMVLACTRRDINFDDFPKIGLFDLVKKNDRWLIVDMGIYRPESAWSTVDGFARNPDVRCEVTRDDIIGNFFVGFNCVGPDTFAEDGTWIKSLSAETVTTGTWRLEGNVLVCEANGAVTKNRIVQFCNGGFTVEVKRSQFASSTGIADELKEAGPDKWMSAYQRTDRQAGESMWTQ